MTVLALVPVLFLVAVLGNVRAFAGDVAVIARYGTSSPRRHASWFPPPGTSPKSVAATISLASSSSLPSRRRTPRSATTNLDPDGLRPVNRRFDGSSDDRATRSEDPCLVTINGIRYDVTSWARSHPGGVDVLRKFHGRDATAAFETAGHSGEAYDALARFALDENSSPAPSDVVLSSSSSGRRPSGREVASYPGSNSKRRGAPGWRAKLFTREDPIGVHKYAGLFVLIHFAHRFRQMIFGDLSAGLGSRRGGGPGVAAAACLLPHAALSLSSLIFRAVPRERIVGKPMIWREFRIHNISFALRSIAATAFAWLSIYKDHAPAWRRLAVVGSCAVTLLASVAADEGTRRLRPNRLESTTATMPYWDGCSVRTQRRFKRFYAFSQFQATATCMAVGNPAWPFSLLLPIQLASFLMTLVRKGIIGARSYHLTYTASLAMPYLVGIRSIMYMKNFHFPLFLAMSFLLFQLRRHGVNKYGLWGTFAVVRILLGDKVLNYARPW